MKNQIYLIDKPAGMTSFDVIRELRRRLRIRRMGHAGTLDPFATGLLIVATGRFTRLTDDFHRYDKVYEARIQLGVSTDTDDTTGSVLMERPVSGPAVTKERITAVLHQMIGTFAQRPPAISAKRVDGRRLYDINREGRAVAAKPVEVTVHDIRVRRVSLPTVDVEITCGTGTYIRSIARDLGEALGTGGAVAELRRTRIGPYALDRASSLSGELTPLAHREILPEIDAVVPETGPLARLLSGSAIHLRRVDLDPHSRVRVFAPYFEELLALCRVIRENGGGSTLQPEKVFGETP